jgi:hypothetical protein
VISLWRSNDQSIDFETGFGEKASQFASVNPSTQLTLTRWRNPIEPFEHWPILCGQYELTARAQKRTKPPQKPHG